VPTLAQLLVAKSSDEREAQLLAYLNAIGFPVTDYYPGSVGRTIQKLITVGLVDFDNLVPQIASGGFLGPFKIGDKTYPTRDWLELLAAEIFQIIPAPATYTRQRVSLWCQAGTGPYTITVGQLTARSRFGGRYSNITGGVVPSGGAKLRLDFQAESPGALFNQDIAGTIVELVTPLPGLLISNEALSFGGLDSAGRAARNGTGTGTVTPQETVSGVAPTGTRRFTLTILTAGQVTTATASLFIDDGQVQSTVSVAPLPASLVVGNGVTLAFANGGQNPSFLVGDLYTFQTPGSPIINAGVDVESDDSLRARCRGRWPSLSAIPTEDRHIAWVRQASIDNGYGVTKISARASVTIAGQTDVLVATSAGAVPGGVVAALQSYINAREGITDLGNVQSAVNKNVTAGGTVTARTSTALAAKLGAKANWEAYIAALPIGGDTPDAVVRLAELEQAIMDAGAVDVSGLTLNGVSANLVLAITEVAVAANSIDSALTWVEVP
jgi:hypothetical protein